MRLCTLKLDMFARDSSGRSAPSLISLRMIIVFEQNGWLLDNADKGQKIFESYGLESVLKLKAIRDKYDPNRVFTDLMPGGFTIDKAEVGGY
jgi:hypothetical protein